MKKNKLTTAVIAGLAGVAGMANAAVHVSGEGTGQVLIYPYYTVNNGLITSYSVVNTTDETKAIKVRFLEGDHSLEVLDFNVYMSPYDVWTGALGSTTSTIGAHAGEPSGMHVSEDTSCAPRLTKAGQEFLPYEIDTDLAASNKSMERSTQGHFEVIEMGVVTGTHAAAALHNSTGVPADCAFLKASWDGGTWAAAPQTDIVDPTGGLFGAATMLNVAEGLAMTYDATALDDFWTGAGNHTDPGSLAPSISESDVESVILLDGSAVYSTWNSGIEAVSSLFMKQQVFNEYAFDSAIAAKSEWVVTFPTKNRHVDTVNLAPFTAVWDGVEACEEFRLTTFDREEQLTPPGGGQISPQPPQGSNPQICQEANVVQFLAPGEVGGAASKVLGATNLISVGGVLDNPNATENGWAAMSFVGTLPMTPAAGAGYEGLPVAGFMVQQYTNANAAPGLMAQYAGLFNHKGDIVSF
ncbi:hypothetical protein [Marinicella rhabdoformis]|uniref:hypothetical protein n=1 Tax=Marinicella rhabdoformis TaxID=2580566 RepID=UPI0012AEDD34|nr:hypothetical protein [Marinicella rhabdoformis]